MGDFPIKAREAEAAMESPAAKDAKRPWHAPRVEVLEIDGTAGGSTNALTENTTFNNS
jgi:hypothetical protein